MSRFLSTKYAKLEAYTPGEQPKDKKYVKLNTNELPYPPAPNVVNSILKSDIKDLNLYPDPTCRDLIEAIAAYKKVKTENVIVTNGSDDALNFAFMAFCDENTGAAFADITYGFYPVFANLNNIDYVEIPLKKDFTIDVCDYKNLGRTIFIANPNAPTGICLPLSDIKFVLENNKDNVVVVDEAYVDFGGESAISLINKYKNLLVVQTFSKSKALAGGRLGYAIGSKALIDDLNLIRYSTNPYNIDRLTLKIGVETINSCCYYEDCCKKIQKNRALVTNKLKELGFTVLDSKANFVFTKHPDVSGKDIYINLKEKGVLVRHFTKKRIKDYNRITIGNQSQNNALIAALTEILEELK